MGSGFRDSLSPFAFRPPRRKITFLFFPDHAAVMRTVFLLFCLLLTPSVAKEKRAAPPAEKITPNPEAHQELPTLETLLPKPPPDSALEPEPRVPAGLVLPPVGPGAPIPDGPPILEPSPDPNTDPAYVLPGPVPGSNPKANERAGRTYSEDSPFIIWGGTQEARSNLFTTAGLVRRDALDALHLGLEWNHPILIQLREPLARSTDRRPPVWTRVSQVPDGFRIEINIVPRHNSVPGTLLRENIVRATLAALILRGHGEEDATGWDTPPPEWLLHGTLALMDYRKQGRKSNLFNLIFQLGSLLSVEEIFGAETEGMDSISQTLYRVSCCGLIMMLIEQPNGPRHLAEMIPSLISGREDTQALITRHFPGMATSANSLSKRWALQIAALAQPGLDEVRSPAESEQLLTGALTLRYVVKPEDKKPGAIRKLFSRRRPDSGDADQAKAGDPGKTPASPAPEEESCDLHEFEKVLSLPDREAILTRVDLNLNLLLLRAHPIYRPVIAEYLNTLKSLIKGRKLKESAESLERLSHTRRQLASNLQEIENFLDDYEVGKMEDKSGAFEEYMRAADDMDKPPAVRPDPVSRYLDALEAEVGR